MEHAAAVAQVRAHGQLGFRAFGRPRSLVNAAISGSAIVVPLLRSTCS
jgi:hypothetical protein